MNNIDFLKKYALKYLSKYDTSKGNLEKILHNKIKRMNYEKKEQFILYNSIKKILDELDLKKIINDENYSDTKIRNFSLQGKSKNFIKSYLLQKRIKEKLINERLENFQSTNPDWEYNSGKIFFIKKKLNYDNKKNKEKSIAKMARAGFEYYIIKKILEIN